jgi:hypothetical protein
MQFGSSLPVDFDAESALSTGFIRRHWGGPPPLLQ